MLKLFVNFLKLVRWPNLMFIVIAQLLFHFSIYKSIFTQKDNTSDTPFFIILCSSFFIAAAGYIINDYFDVNIDQVNKPKKVVVGEYISRRWVIFWHMIFSVVGIYLSTLVFSFKDYWHIHLANLVTILLLWFYSTNFKKNLLIGNIIIAILTAWSIAVVYFSKFTITELAHPPIHSVAHVRFFKLMLLYAAFAFILTLVREALKDMEDIEGDEKFGCKTLPIIWGLMPTKIYVAIWIIVVVFSLAIIQLYILPFGWWLSIAYCFITIIAPLLYVLVKLPKSFNSKDFALLSFWIKIAMLTGILSMSFFYFLF